MSSAVGRQCSASQVVVCTVVNVEPDCDCCAQQFYSLARSVAAMLREILRAISSRDL